MVIGEDDLAEICRFPWPRNIPAKAIDNLAVAGAKVIALDIIFNEPEEGAGLKALRELNKAYADLDLPNKDPAAETFYGLLGKAEADLDNDVKLAEAFKKAGNVVFPIYLDAIRSWRRMCATHTREQREWPNISER